jgi:putative ABC transport system permease protein
VLHDSLSQQRFTMFLLNFFAGLALLLTAVGLYGLIAYSVTQRTHEMGIRMALGAKPRNVLMLVLNYGLKLAVVGTVLGLLAAFAGTRLISSLLYGVSATSPLIFVGASLALLAVALLACLIPARRASRVPPIVALREE